MNEIQQALSTPTNLISALGGIVVLFMMLGFVGIAGNILSGLALGLGIAGCLGLLSAPMLYWLNRDLTGAICVAISSVMALALCCVLAKIIGKANAAEVVKEED